MSEFRDDLISEALGEFHASEITAGPAAPGAHAARATAAHRRKVRITTLSVLGVLLVVVPIAAFAANPRGNNSPPDIAATPTATADAPSPTPSASSSTQYKPITIEDLVADRASVPAFSGGDCHTTVGAKLATNTERDVYAAKAVETNLDEDAELETAAWVVCVLFEGTISQVAGYERDAGGGIVSLGAVVKEPAPPHDYTGMEARAGGGVIVNVAYDNDSGEPGDPEGQRREFAWRDGAFRQVGGPTEFKRANADLKLTVVGDLLWPKAGQNTAALTLRLENKGPEDAPLLEIMVAMDGVIKIVGEGGDPGVLKQQGLKAGQTVELRLTLTLDPSANPVDPNVQVFAFINDPSNDNTATIKIVRQ